MVAAATIGKPPGGHKADLRSEPTRLSASGALSLPASMGTSVRRDERGAEPTRPLAAVWLDGGMSARKSTPAPFVRDPRSLERALKRRQKR